jgi:predicted ATPase
MLDWGRELFDVFLPPARPASAERAPGGAYAREMLPPALLFQQYINVLHKLAEKVPLLLLVDDVQWADRSSLALLLHLVQRLGDSRILLIIALPDVSGVEAHHPLHEVLAAVQQHYGDVVLNLAQSDGRAWVDAYVDSLPNRLDSPFRHALFRHTDGNPMAVIELMQLMQEQGTLAQDDYGAWVAPATIPWAQLPGRAEAVVQTLLDRLPLAVRQTLQAASIQGMTFIAEVAAEVQGIDAAAVLEHLSHELVQRHHLVEPIRWARINGRKLAHFAFSRHLWAQGLLASLPAAKRTDLHARTAQALTALYGAEARTFEGALALAWHSTRGGLLAQAQSSLCLLGEQAAAWSALPEAASYLTEAIARGGANAAPALPLLLARETVYRCQGDDEARNADLATLEQLVLEVDDPRSQADVLLRRAQAACDRGAAVEGLDAATDALNLIQTAGAGDDLVRQALAQRWQGEALLRQNDYAAASAALQSALRAAQAAGAAHLEADILRALGACLARAGQYEASRERYEQALLLCHQIGYRTGEAASRHSRGIVLLQQGRIDLARDAYGKTLAFCRRIGDQVGEAYALLSLAAQNIALGHDAAAMEAAESALAVSQQIDAPSIAGHALVALSVAQRHLQGDRQIVVEHAQAALDIGQRLDDWRIRRAALLALADGAAWAGKYVKAQDVYWQAVDAARDAGKDDELALFALTGLVELALAADAAELAAMHALEIRRLLSAQPAAGLDTLARPTLAAYRALVDRDAEAALALLWAGYRQLLAGAEHILDTALRESYLQDVAHHRDLAAAVTAHAATCAAQGTVGAASDTLLNIDGALELDAEASPAPAASHDDQMGRVRRFPWPRRPKVLLRWWPVPAAVLLTLITHR